MAFQLKPIHEQTIVITGASSGIGLVTARMAAKQGAKLVLVARNQDALTQLQDEIRSQGGRAIAVVADIGQEESSARIVETATTEFGGFDTWVNNAGVSIFGHIEDVPVADIKRMFDTNFWGAVYATRAALKHFREQNKPGALIYTGSFFGDRATPVQSTYSASKHALHGFADSLRMELEAQKVPVSVTMIHPGRIDTPYNEHARSYMPMQPVHKGMIYPPVAVAEAILYAAEHVKRDVFVGSQAKLFAVLGTVVPRLVDKIMEVWMYPSQQSSTRPSHGPTEKGLYEPGYGLQERGTHEGWIRSRSYYVKATKHPAMTTLALAGLGLAVTALVVNRRR